MHISGVPFLHSQSIEPSTPSRSIPSPVPPYHPTPHDYPLPPTLSARPHLPPPSTNTFSSPSPSPYPPPFVSLGPPSSSPPHAVWAPLFRLEPHQAPTLPAYLCPRHSSCATRSGAAPSISVLFGYGCCDGCDCGFGAGVGAFLAGGGVGDCDCIVRERGPLRGRDNVGAGLGGVSVVMDRRGLKGEKGRGKCKICTRGLW